MEIETIAKLNVEDGDVVVIRCPRVLGERERTYIAASMAGMLEKLGKKGTVIVLDGGISIELLKTSQLPDAI